MVRGLPKQIRHHGIEIMDHAQTIATQGERVRHAAEAEFAAIENVLAIVASLRRAVRHHHFGDGRAIDDGPPFAVLGIADGIKHQSLAPIEAHAKVPVFPGHLVALHHETGAIGLHHIEPGRRLAKLMQKLRIVIQRRARNRNVISVGREMIMDIQHLQRAHINQRVQPLDRVGIIVVEGKHPHPDEAVEHPAPLLDGDVEVARGPRIDADIFELSEQAAAAQRFLKTSIGLDRRFDIQDLLDGKHRPRLFSEGLRDNLGAAEIHQPLPHTHDPMLIDIETRDARRQRFGVVVAHHILGGLVDVDGLDPQVRAPLEVVLENTRDLCDLTCGERIQRMVDRDTGIRSRKHLLFSKASRHSSLSYSPSDVPRRGVKSMLRWPFIRR